MSNFGIKSYYKPTPKRIRKLADAVLSATVFAGSSATLNGHPVIGTIIFCIGYVAKIVSNFFSEDEVQDTTE